jgi:hypothetical protein
MFDYSGLDAAMLHALCATKVGIMFAASETTRMSAKPAASSCAVISAVLQKVLQRGSISP